jgi:squalene-hopene/tetraprenyl-beta-curcumene cyclase
LIRPIGLAPRGPRSNVGTRRKAGKHPYGQEQTVSNFGISLRIALVVAALVCYSAPLPAAEPVTLENFTTPEPNRADEPFAKQFSLGQALHFLDSASLEWQTSWQCFTCHTNVSYLIARPTAASLAEAYRTPNAKPDAPAHQAVRKFAEEMITQRWEEVGSRFDAEVVAVGAALALNDAATTGKLHPLTRVALDRMWTGQRETGDWEWPTGCRWPPFESDDHYGVTLALVGTGAAPEGYSKTPAAQAGLAKIRRYLKAHPPENLHHKGMLLWASSYFDDLLTADEKKSSIRELLADQRPDGGWIFARLYPWDRADEKEQDLETTDAYGTAFAVFTLRKSGVPVDEPAVARGVAWLKTKQRESGRWFTRSLNKDNEHFISHAASAYAVMALAECEAKWFGSGPYPVPESASPAGGTPAARGSAKPSLKLATKIEGLAPAVAAYLAEQNRRRELHLTGLRTRLAENERDPAKAGLVPVLKQQLADLEKKPAEDVGFDAAYGYGLASGRLGFSKKVRFLENLPDGRAVLLIDSGVLIVGGLSTADYQHGKFFGIPHAIFVGKPREDYVFRGKPKKTFDAELVDLSELLKRSP